MSYGDKILRTKEELRPGARQRAPEAVSRHRDLFNGSDQKCVENRTKTRRQARRHRRRRRREQGLGRS